VTTNHISGTADRLRRRQLSSPASVKLLMVVGQLLITPTVEICIQHRPSGRNGLITYMMRYEIFSMRAEPLSRTGLSAAAESEDCRRLNCSQQ